MVLWKISYCPPGIDHSSRVLFCWAEGLRSPAMPQAPDSSDYFASSGSRLSNEMSRICLTVPSVTLIPWWSYLHSSLSKSLPLETGVRQVAGQYSGFVNERLR